MSRSLSSSDRKHSYPFIVSRIHCIELFDWSFIGRRDICIKGMMLATLLSDPTEGREVERRRVFEGLQCTRLDGLWVKNSIPYQVAGVVAGCLARHDRAGTHT